MIPQLPVITDADAPTGLRNAGSCSAGEPAPRICTKIISDTYADFGRGSNAVENVRTFAASAPR